MNTGNKANLQKLIALSFACCIACGISSACTIGTPNVTTTPGSSAADPNGNSFLNNSPLLDAAGMQKIQKTVERLERDGNAVGVAIFGEHGVAELGSLREEPAWSTVKIPLATAALQNPNTVDPQPLVEAAITESDNFAAETMWNQLGTAEEAAGKVSEVINKTGDTKIIVPNEVQVPGYSAFGQTRWGLADQAGFLAHWRCEPEASTVIEAMRNVVPEHRYGLGQIEGAAIKGGWGPDEQGYYLVRQAAIVPWANGEITITVAAKPDDGTYETGKAMLDTLTGDVQEFLRQTTPGDSDWEPLKPC